MGSMLQWVSRIWLTSHGDRSKINICSGQIIDHLTIKCNSSAACQNRISNEDFVMLLPKLTASTSAVWLNVDKACLLLSTNATRRLPKKLDTKDGVGATGAESVMTKPSFSQRIRVKALSRKKHP